MEKLEESMKDLIIQDTHTFNNDGNSKITIKSKNKKTSIKNIEALIKNVDKEIEKELKNTNINPNQTNIIDKELNQKKYRNDKNKQSNLPIDSNNIRNEESNHSQCKHRYNTNN